MYSFNTHWLYLNSNDISKIIYISHNPKCKFILRNSYKPITTDEYNKH